MIWDSFESHYLIKKDWYQEVKGGGGKSHGRMSNFHRDAEVNYIKKKKKVEQKGAMWYPGAVLYLWVHKAPFKTRQRVAKYPASFSWIWNGTDVIG